MSRTIPLPSKQISKKNNRNQNGVTKLFSREWSQREWSYVFSGGRFMKLHT